MQVKRETKDSVTVYSCVTTNGLRYTYAQFTPLQPMLNAIRLLDCVPTRRQIPGVGIRWSSSRPASFEGYAVSPDGCVPRIQGNNYEWDIFRLED